MPTIHFRQVASSDADAIAAIYAPYVRDTVVSFETEAPDSREIARRIVAVASHYPWLVAEQDGAVVGYAYACEHRSRRAYRWSVDVAVYLAPRAQRQGIGRALYRRVLALLRLLGYVNAYGGIALPNDASVGLHESLGFVPVGVYRHVGFKQGRWHDVGWWQRSLTGTPTMPAEPQAIGQLEPPVIRRVMDDPAISS
jgi:L-amino acid N-acyltransferase YncA